LKDPITDGQVMLIAGPEGFRLPTSDQHERPATSRR